MKYSNNFCGNFWSKVEVGNPGDCWVFAGATSSRGYGNVKGPNGHTSAHRIAWEIAFFEIPPGFVVCHACDNRLCCNPNHLLLGKQSANILDMHKKGRKLYSSPIGEDHYNSKLTTDDVLTIRAAYDDRESTQTQLAEIFGVTQGLIGQIVRREAWKHI